MVEFHNASVHLEGRCALTDTRTGEAAPVVFPQDVFRMAWLRLNQCGWRGQHSGVLEATTGYPAKAREATAER